MLFRGTFQHTIDDKGRVSVPARFRDHFVACNDDRIIVTNFFNGSLRCLDVYPHAAWLELEAHVQARPRFDPDVSAFRDYYFGGAHDCSLDKQGRILLPTTLRDHAALKRDATFVGMGEKFQIWDRDVRESLHTNIEQSLMNNPRRLADLGV